MHAEPLKRFGIRRSTDVEKHLLHWRAVPHWQKPAKPLFVISDQRLHGFSVIAYTDRRHQHYDDEASEPVVERSGRFWFHVDTEIGMTHPDYPIHTMRDPSQTPYGLANHYSSLVPEYTYMEMHPIGPLLSTLPWDRLVEWFFPCRNCAPGDLSIQRPPWAVNPNETLVMASIDTVAGKFAGFVSPSGGIWTSENLVPEPVVSALSDSSLKWIAPAEANPLIGRGVNSPTMVAVALDGTSVARTLVNSPNGLVLMGDGIVRSSLGAPSATNQTAAPRHGFSATYARSVGLVLLVGGQEPAQTSDEGPVLAIDVATGERMQLPVSGYTPGNVVAATYSGQDKALWLIEEKYLQDSIDDRCLTIDSLNCRLLNDMAAIINHYLSRVSGTSQLLQVAQEVHKNSQQLWVQIVRIGVPDGIVRTYGPWPRFKHNNKLWLATDIDGRVVLVASSEKLSKYSVRRLREKDGKLRSDWIHRSHGETLGGGPILDLSGLRLMMSTGAIVRVGDYEQLVRNNWDNSGNDDESDNSDNSGDDIDTIEEALE